MSVTLRGGAVVDFEAKEAVAKALTIEPQGGRPDSLSNEAARGSFDAEGCFICSGFVDLRSVFANSSDVEAALAAGVTRALAAPNSSAVPLLSQLRWPRAQALFNAADARLLSEVSDDVRYLSNGAVPLADLSAVRRALMYTAPLECLVLLNAELASLSASGVVAEGAVSTRLGLKAVPASAETAAVAAVLEIAREESVRIHLSHLTCARSVELVADAKRRKVQVSCDVAAVHLIHDESQAVAFSPVARVWPPLRSEADRFALRAGVANGTIDAIAFDHLSSVSDEPETFEARVPGVASYAWATAALLQLHHKWPIDNVIDVNTFQFRMLEALSVAPRRLLNLPLESGDYTVFEQSTGKVVATFVEGHLVYCDSNRMRSEKAATHSRAVK